MMNEELTKDECLAILSLYKTWNINQKSTSLAFNGVRDPIVDDLLDSRRELLTRAQKRLSHLALMSVGPENEEQHQVPVNEIPRNSVLEKHGYYDA